MSTSVGLNEIEVIFVLRSDFRTHVMIALKTNLPGEALRCVDASALPRDTIMIPV